MAVFKFSSGSSYTNEFLAENPPAFSTWLAVTSGIDGSQAYPGSYQSHTRIDTNGNIYVVGQTSGGIGSKGYFCKITPIGTLETYKRNSYNNSVVRGVTTDSSNNIYIVSMTNDNGQGFILTKFNSKIEQLWQVNIDYYSTNGSYYYSPVSLTLDSSGNIYVACHAQTDNRFSIVKVNPSNGAVLASYYWTNSSSTPYDVAVDSSGNMYIGGQSTAAGGGFYPATFIKANSSGTFQWGKYISTNNGYSYPDGNVYSIKTDSSNNVYVLGNVGVSSTRRKTFLIKFDTSGNLLWKKFMYSTAGSNQYGGWGTLMFDLSGNVYAQTSIYNTGTSTKCQIFKFDASGNLQWQRELATINSASYPVESTNIVLDSTGNYFYISGYLYVGTNPAGFIVKLPIDGTKTGTFKFDNNNVATYSVCSYTIDDSTEVTINSTTSFTLGSDRNTFSNNVTDLWSSFPSLFLNSSSI